MIAPALALLVAVLLQATPIDVGVNSGGKFAFDWSGNYADGSTMAEATYVEFHYVPVPPTPIIGPGDGHATVGFPFVAITGENVVTMKTSLDGVPAGIYDLSVRLFGPAGNPSTYSTPVLALRVRIKNPDAPTNVRVVGD